MITMAFRIRQRVVPGAAFGAGLAMLLLLVLPAPLAAQTGPTRTRQEVWMAQYWDESRQQVSTVAGKARVALNPDWQLGLKALGEWIRIPGMADTGSHDHSAHIHEGHEGDDPGGASMDVDAVSGASIRAHGHHGSGEGRGEATLSLQRDLRGAAPASLGGSVRYSGESDFHSGMATLNGGIELFQRNTALTGFLGAGLDYSAPTEAPPGQAEDWPASSSRVAAGVQVGQLLSPRVQGGLSYAFTALAGTLENPYRRARIITTLFPERLPDARYRHVVGAELGGYLGFGVALFHREGGYMDSWGVRAWIPETALPIEIGGRWMITPKHKYYYQLPAEFYRTSYPSLDGWYSGDVRLGHLEGHEFGVDLEYTLGDGALASSIGISASLSDFTYLSGNRKERSYVMALSWKKDQ